MQRGEIQTLIAAGGCARRARGDAFAARTKAFSRIICAINILGASGFCAAKFCIGQRVDAFIFASDLTGRARYDAFSADARRSRIFCAIYKFSIELAAVIIICRRIYAFYIG